jgi:Thiamine monophosphate kinase
VEQQLIDWLVAKLAADPRLDVPNGDDAAVLRPPAGRRTVFCTDMLCEGVHFSVSPPTTTRGRWGTK